MTRDEIEFRILVITAKRELLQADIKSGTLSRSEIDAHFEKIEQLTRDGMELYRMLPEYADYEVRKK
jgi:hypothetical protein